MEPVILEDVLAQLRMALEANDLTTASSVIEALRPADQADVFADLDEEHQATLLPQINPADAADIIEELFNKKIFSRELFEFYDKKALKSNLKIYDKYKSRLVFFYRWYKYWEKDIN